MQGILVLLPSISVLDTGHSNTDSTYLVTSPTSARLEGSGGQRIGVRVLVGKRHGLVAQIEGLSHVGGAFNSLKAVNGVVTSRST